MNIRTEHVIEKMEVVKAYRKTVQQLACTFALITLSFVDAYIKDFEPNDLAYYALTGLAGYTIFQSVNEKIKSQKNKAKPPEPPNRGDGFTEPLGD